MILVTGGSGLVGSHLMWELLRTYPTVKAVHRAGSDLERVRKVFGTKGGQPDEAYSRIEWIQADLTDIPALMAEIGARARAAAAELAFAAPEAKRGALEAAADRIVAANQADLAAAAADGLAPALVARLKLDAAKLMVYRAASGAGRRGIRGSAPRAGTGGLQYRLSVWPRRETTSIVLSSLLKP